MEIGGISDILSTAATRSILGLSGTYLAGLLAVSAVRVRIRLPRPPFAGGPVISWAPAVGFALALSGGPVTAAKRLPIAPPARSGGAGPPLSDASGFPPPRPLARTEATDNPSEHPAIHPRRHGRRSAPLFPRGRRSAAEQERAEAMQRHPAGKASPDTAKDRQHEVTTTQYVVRAGDTLWSIAQHELQTDDQRAIARFWPKIHRANRGSISDPGLIMPGQILVIPDTKEG